MKKTVLIAVIALFAFCSCEKIDLTEQVPQLKGSWQWHQTAVGGFVGVINPETTQNLVLTFEDDNKISIECNGETVVAGTFMSESLFSSGLHPAANTIAVISTMAAIF